MFKYKFRFSVIFQDLFGGFCQIFQLQKIVELSEKNLSVLKKLRAEVIWKGKMLYRTIRLETVVDEINDKKALVAFGDKYEDLLDKVVEVGKRVLPVIFIGLILFFAKDIKEILETKAKEQKNQVEESVQIEDDLQHATDMK